MWKAWAETLLTDLHLCSGQHFVPSGTSRSHQEKLDGESATEKKTLLSAPGRAPGSGGMALRARAAAAFPRCRLAPSPV